MHIAHTPTVLHTYTNKHTYTHTHTHDDTLQIIASVSRLVNDRPDLLRFGRDSLDFILPGGSFMLDVEF